MSLSVLLVGDGSLLTTCAKHLIDHQHNIVAVVSSTKLVETWCEKAQVLCFNDIDTCLCALPNEIDYLFSIVNGQILKPHVLSRVKYAAINYHDSLLPRYAGVHATTWALINGESEHGITWHIIEAGIDTGDVVCQQKVLIDPADTAVTLNLRCFEAATEAFLKVLSMLENNALNRLPQELSLRSYYGATKVLPNAGFIDWGTMCAAVIARYARALNFGHYKNSVGLLKCCFGNAVVVLKEVSVAVCDSGVDAGTILSLSEDKLVISSVDNAIAIKEIYALTGELIDMRSFFETQGICVGSMLHSQESKVFIPDYKESLKREKSVVASLLSMTPHSVFPDRAKLGEEHESKDFSLDCKGLSRSTVLAGIMVYLYRLHNYDSFSFLLCGGAFIQSNIFSQALPLHVAFSPDITVTSAVDLAKEYLLRSEGFTYLKDVFVRHPELVSMRNERFITVNVSDEATNMPSNSFLHFTFHAKTEKLMVSHRLNLTYQGGMLGALFQYMEAQLSTLLDVVHADPKRKVNNFCMLGSVERECVLQHSVGDFLSFASVSFDEIVQKTAMQYTKENFYLDRLGTHVSYAEFLVQLARLHLQQIKGVVLVHYASVSTSFTTVLRLISSGVTVAMFKDISDLRLLFADSVVAAAKICVCARAFSSVLLTEFPGVVCYESLSDLQGKAQGKHVAQTVALDTLGIVCFSEASQQVAHYSQRDIVRHVRWVARNAELEVGATVGLSSGVSAWAQFSYALSACLSGATVCEGVGCNDAITHLSLSRDFSEIQANGINSLPCLTHLILSYRPETESTDQILRCALTRSEIQTLVLKC